jgi:hypothetical protein
MSSLRVAVVGASLQRACGVRDHAGLLAQALAAEEISCSWHWLTRRSSCARASAAEVRAWTGTLATELDGERPDAVLLHYSVFSLSHRGLPVFVPGVLAALGARRRPLLAFLHELVFPWGRDGARGAAWAASQRVAIAALMQQASAAIVSTDLRARWLSSRVWLASRPLAVAPVFSNLPPPQAVSRETRAEPRIGLFGFAAGSIDTVLDAMAELAGRGVPVRLVLFGAAGERSAAGLAWSAAARARGLAERVGFAGELPAQELSDALAACEVLIFIDGPGPTSRKGTLAASLASGAPVLALDGPQTWQELRSSGAAMLVAPSSAGLAAGLAELLEDPQARRSLGERGLAFAHEQMSVQRSSRVVAGVLRELTGVTGLTAPTGAGTAAGAGAGAEAQGGAGAGRQP